MNTLTDNKEKVNTQKEIIDDPFEGYEPNKSIIDIVCSTPAQEQQQEPKGPQIVMLDETKLAEFDTRKQAAKASKNKIQYTLIVEEEKAYKKSIAAQNKELEKAAAGEYKKFMSKLSDDKPNPELKYAEHMSLSPIHAKDERDENVALYEWNEHYWDRLTTHQAEKIAFDWVSKTYPKFASSNFAKNANKAAQFWLNPLPSPPSDTVIPLENTWIVLQQDGNLRIKLPDRAMGITYMVNAKLSFKPMTRYYTPKELPTTSKFYKYLVSSLPDEKERKLVQEYCGYTLTNNTRYQVAQVWEGDGSNGKSVLLNIIAALHKRSVSLDLDKLDDFELAPIQDASLVISAETPKGRLNENTIKKCIVGDVVAVQKKYQATITYSPTAKWLIACNRFPRIQDESDGMFRRLQFIRWSQKFEGDEIIRDLDKQIISEELHLVVDWCLQGLQNLTQRNGFDVPESVKDRITEEKIASNSVLGFVNDCDYVIDPVGHKFVKSNVMKAYKQYCEDNGATQYGDNEFWKRLARIFPTMTTSKVTINGMRQPCVNLMFKPQPLDDSPVPF